MIGNSEFIPKHLKLWGNLHKFYEKIYIILPSDRQPKPKRVTSIETLGETEIVEGGGDYSLPWAQVQAH